MADPRRGVQAFRFRSFTTQSARECVGHSLPTLRIGFRGILGSGTARRGAATAPGLASDRHEELSPRSPFALSVRHRLRRWSLRARPRAPSRLAPSPASTRGQLPHRHRCARGRRRRHPPGRGLPPSKQRGSRPSSLSPMVCLRPRAQRWLRSPPRRDHRDRRPARSAAHPAARGRAVVRPEGARPPRPAPRLPGARPRSTRPSDRSSSRGSRGLDSASHLGRLRLRPCCSRALRANRVRPDRRVPAPPVCCPAARRGRPGRGRDDRLCPGPASSPPPLSSHLSEGRPGRAR